MKGDKQRTVANNMKFLIGNAWRWDKRLFICFGLYTIITALLPFIGIFTPKLLIDELMNQKRIEFLIIILVSFFLISAITNYLTSYLYALCYPRMTKLRFKYINMLQKKCMTMDFQHTEDKDILNNVDVAWNALNNDSDGIQGVYIKLFGVLGSMISLLGYITIVITLSPLVLLYLITNVVITYFLTLRAKKFEHSKKDENAEYNRKANYIYNTMADFAYGKDIRIYELGDWLSSKLKNFRNGNMGIFKKVKYKYFSAAVVDITLLLLREGIIYTYLIFKVLVKGMSIGDFTMYFSTIGGFADWMKNIIADLAHIRAQNLYINDFRDFLEMDMNIEETNELKQIPEADKYEIEFKNVVFKYPNSDKYIYRNLNLKIKGGQKLAIVGINGAGKTTFVKLLTRLYDPVEGEILLNGINIKEFSKEEYFKLFSVVFQEIKMFPFTVSENIALTEKENIDEQKVRESIFRADIHEKINSLTKGIDTNVLKILDENGIEFSGGENQKIALARALYKNGDIVILDEPTAALDAIAEHKTYTKFNEMIGNKTAIYISHRLASTRFCDVIAFFEDGEIKEYGSHEELLSQNGRYTEMFNVQAQYYKEEEEVA